MGSGLRLKMKQPPDLLPMEPHVVPITSLLPSIVLVGLWDGKMNRIVEVGSGFIVDKKRGLIVTAAHTVLNVWDDHNRDFGMDYKGLKQGKIVIGVIPQVRPNNSCVVF